MDHIQNFKSIGVIFQTGCGKTITAIASCVKLLENYPDRKCIIITPPSLQDNYKKEMIKFGLGENDSRFIFFTFMSPKKNKNIFINLCKDNIVVIDEVHTLKSQVRKGKFYCKTKDYIFNCVWQAFRIILLTATPMVNGIQDLLSLYSLLKGKAYKNTDEIKELIESKEENKNIWAFQDVTCDSDVPFREIHFKYILLKGQTKTIYSILEENVEGRRTMILINMLRASSILFDAYYKPKIEWIISRKHTKSLIYTVWITSGINELTRLMKDFNYAVITGSTPKSERQNIVNKFNNDLFNILIISSAGSEGLDLKGVRDVYILEPGWNYSKLEQVMGRAVRVGSHLHLPEDDRRVDIWFTILQRDDSVETIDEKLFTKYVNTKKALIDQVKRVLESYSI